MADTSCADRYGQHPLRRIEVQREVNRASTAKPKMLALADLAPVAIETAVRVGGKGFRQEQLALME
jgi:hypothetical protein